MNTISSAIYPPEYASSSVVVMVPMAARPTFIPERIASRLLMPGHFSTTSFTALVMSTARSMMAPEEPIKMLAMKICVRLKS